MSANNTIPRPHYPSGPCSADIDNHFGPILQCGDFDFTLYFEQAILGIGLSGAWILIFLLRLSQLPRKPNVVKKSPIHAAKIVS
jgi:ATP-binding cassette subfamily C (CFTR/MRP) protein 1